MLIFYCGSGAVQFRQSNVFIFFVSGAVQFRQSIVDLQKIILYNSYFFWFAKFFQYCFYFLNIEGNFVFILLWFKSLGLLGGVGFLHLHSSLSFNSPCLAILIFAVFPNSFNFCFFWIITGSFVLISKSLVFIGDFGFLHPQFFFWSKSPLSLCNPPFDVDGYPPFSSFSLQLFSPCYVVYIHIVVT